MERAKTQPVIGRYPHTLGPCLWHGGDTHHYPAVPLSRFGRNPRVDMSGQWWRSATWDDTGDDEPTDATHRCRVCDHGARISTPQRRTEHYCTECDAWQRFESVVNDRA